MNAIYSLFRRIIQIPKEAVDLYTLRRSGLFDGDWYLVRNPDVVGAKVNPALHYLRHGGFEGRDPSPEFSSSWYLEMHEDVRQAGINPLIHYMKYGRREGRRIKTSQIDAAALPYRCPVCEKKVKEFLPLNLYYEENRRKYGNPFGFDDVETLNSRHYTCPYCGASDRDRLYACYLKERLSALPATDRIYLLDIAPSKALDAFINRNEKIIHHTADLYMEGVDFIVDVTDMPSLPSNSYDILICSHVLEHVSDDRKAMAELYRVLKPEGWGIIMVPINLVIQQIDEDPQVTDIAERWRRFGQADHVRLYNKSGFVGRLEEAGFKVRQLGRDYFGRDVFGRYGIAEGSVLYIAEK